MALKAVLDDAAVPRGPTADAPRASGRIERRKARTRAGLLAAARELFAANGVQQTTIAEIAGHADIAIGSFYNYFATKDELLDALLADELARQLRRLRERQAEVSDPAEKISIAHRHLVRAAAEDANWAWLLVRLEAPYRIAWSVLGPAARSDLREGIEAGRFEVTDETLALNASAGALFAVIHARLVGELGEDSDSGHAELVLRSFGLHRREAAEVAHRPLPPVVAEKDEPR